VKRQGGTGSLRLRLLVAGGASILLALALAGFGLVLLFERHVERRVALELETHLRQLIDGLERAQDGALQLAACRPNRVSRTSRRTLLADRGGTAPTGGGAAAVLRSRSLWDEILRLPPDPLGSGEVHQHTIPGPSGASLLALERRVALPASLGGGSLRVAVAMDRAEISAAGHAFAAELAPSLAVLAAFLIAAAWVQVTVGLRPLGELRRRLGAVRAGGRRGSARRIPVTRCGRSPPSWITSWMRRTRRSRGRGRAPPTSRMASRPAHRPRRRCGAVARARRGRDRGGDRGGHRDHAAACRTRVGAGAGRARGQRGHQRRPPRSRGRSWASCAARRAGRRSLGHRYPGRPRHGPDAQDLAEILGNLAENAAKWARSRVRLEGRRDEAAAGTVVLAVEDDGPGIPEDEADRALARGERLDATKPGSGLGLAIVADMLEALGASLRLGRSESLGGLRAEVRLPGRRDETVTAGRPPRAPPP